MPREIMLPPSRREARVRAESFDEQANTIDVVFTTGARVRRSSWRDGEFDEELMVTPEAVRLSRLNSGAPFLDTHYSYALDGVIGAVVPGSARIASGEGLATIKLTKRDAAQGIVADIRDGVINNVSVGYRTHKIEIEERDGMIPLHRAIDWEPYEISAVPVPADPDAQIRAAAREASALQPCIVIGRSPAVRNALARMRLAEALISR